MFASLIFAGHAVVTTCAAFAPAAPECRMVLVVTGGMITAFDCQVGETECTGSEYPICTKVREGTVSVPVYHCRCCDVPDEEGILTCSGQSEHTDYCTVTITVTNGNAVMNCTPTGHCTGGMVCPVPAPVTGVAKCPCQ